MKAVSSGTVKARNQSLSSREIARLSSMSVEDLYIEIGLAIHADTTVRKILGAKARHPLGYELRTELSGRKATAMVVAMLPSLPSREELARRAKALFSRSRKALYQEICVKWKYCEIKGEYGNEAELAKALVGVIAYVIAPLPVTALYALVLVLIKLGLDKFCHCPKPKKKQ